MKKTVFLLCLFIFTTSFETANAGKNDEIYDFGNYDIIIDDYFSDESLGISIEKTGINPFYTILCKETEKYIINGVIKTDDDYIVYGSNHVTGNPTYYDSMFIVIDELGNILHQVTIDFDDLEEIVGAYYINDTLIIHTEQSIEFERDYEYGTNYFSSYDQSYNFIETIEIRPEILKTSSNDNYVLLNYEYKGDYDVGIKDDLSIVLPNDIIDITNQEIFINEVFIDFLNDASLNNETIENGVYLDYPGIYKLEYNNSEYNFIIKPIISGVEDNKYYTEGISPTISAGNVILNNDLFISGTEISDPGNYELTVNGINNYTETYNFTITSNMEGITNNHTYFNPVSLSFNGEGYLNNQFINSPIDVSEVGEYILKIRGENNYLETYYFKIEAITETMTFVSFVQKFDIFILVIVLVSGGIILKKK